MSSASEPSKSEKNFPLNVAIGFDMEDGLKPVMFSFVIETPPNQLKLLAGLADIIEQARHGKCRETDRHRFHEALQRARFVASNSAFNAILKRHAAAAPPMPQTGATLEEKQPQEGNQQRPSFTRRRRRLFSRQGTPMPEVPSHLKSRTDGALEFIGEDDEEERKDAFSEGDASTPSAVLQSVVDDQEDEEDRLSDVSDLLSDDNSPEPHAEEQPRAGNAPEAAEDDDESDEEYVPPSRSTRLPFSGSSVGKLWDDDEHADAASGSSSHKSDSTDAATSTPLSKASDLSIEPCSNTSEGDQAAEHSASPESSAEVSLESVHCKFPSTVTPCAPAAPQTKSSTIRTAMRAHRVVDSQASQAG